MTVTVEHNGMSCEVNLFAQLPEEETVDVTGDDRILESMRMSNTREALRGLVERASSAAQVAMHV